MRRQHRAQLFLRALENRITPNTYTVTSLADTGANTLRAAITSANGNGGADTVNFNISGGGTILLASELAITDSVVIQGPNTFDITVSGNNSVRIFSLTTNPSLNVTINNLTMTKGKTSGGGGALVSTAKAGNSITFNSCQITNNTASSGGAIGITNATLSIVNCTVNGNSATGGNGGAIDGVLNSITINSSNVVNNSASGSGGGIGQGNSTVQIISSTVSGNLASLGAGLSTYGGSVLIDGSSLNSNTSSGSGAAISTSSPLTISNSTLAGNSSAGNGGAVNTSNFLTVTSSTLSGNKGSQGGAFYITGTPGTLLLRNTTISTNTAADGGGFRLFGCNTQLQLQNCTVTNNTATTNGGGINRFNGTGTIAIESTILAGNFDTSGGTSPDVENNGTQFSYKKSALGTTIGLSSPISDLGGNFVGAALGLGTLANNGGPVLTHRPSNASVLIDAGSNPATLTFDARGVSRSWNGKTDIGAVEVPVTTPVLNAADSGAGSLRQYILDANLDRSAGANTASTVTFDTAVFAGTVTIALSTGELPITDALTINGPSAKLTTLTSNKTSRLFNTANGALNTSIIISGLTLSNGSASDGGAMLIGDESMTISDCALTGNSAPSSDGGAIHVTAGGTLTVRNCTFAGNVSGYGAAIDFFNLGGSLLAENCTFSGNTATSKGGAIYFNGNAGAGGIIIRSSTMIGNSAFTGGGIYRTSGTGNLTLASTVVSGNTATSVSDIYSTVAVNANFCAIGVSIGFTLSGTSGSNLAYGLNLKLGALANNGGPTQTMLPAFDSPLVDKGSSTLTFDQRGSGFPRVWNGVADIGAVETLPQFIVRNDNDSGVDSLRQQVMDANTFFGPNTITFDAAAFAATDDTITLTSGQIVIADNTTITGPGLAAATVSGNNVSRVFLMNFGLNTTLSGLTITKGNAFGGNGGGVYATGGTMNIQQCLITSNSASYDGGVYQASGNLALTDSQVTNNTATSGNIGGVAVVGAATITRSTISGNIAIGGIGGLYVKDSLSLDSSTVSGNSAGNNGGGLMLGFGSGPFLIRNSTISGNTANSGGGGLALGYSGSAPFNAAVAIQNSTIVSNKATTGSGGGIVRLFGNGTISIDSSIVALNTASSAADISSAGVVNVNFSAMGSSSGFTLTGGNNLATGTSLKLRPLSDNGGPTKTHAFDYNSPLIDKGSNPSPTVSLDQRGIARGSASVDIGAFESQTVVVNDKDSGVGSLRNAIAEANRVFGYDTVTFDATAFAATDHTITLTSGELFILDGVSIVGPGATAAAVSGNNASGILYIDAASASSITISGLTLTGGYAAFGGAIRFFDEILTLTSVAVLGNTASSYGGGVYGADDGQLIATSSVFANNINPFGYGGGIMIYSPNASLTLTDSTLSGNQGYYGGAVYFLCAGGTILFRNTTITANTAVGGGGIYATAKTFAVESTIISGNSATFSPDVNSLSGVNVNSSAIGSAFGFTLSGANNLPFGADLKLGPLANNGGPTLTHMPAFDSPVIDQGSNPASLTVDQRGFIRGAGFGYDIGAVEVFTTKVSSIIRTSGASTNLANVSWTVGLSSLVTGLSTANFALSGAGASGASITSVTGSGSVYTVTAKSGSDGALELDFVNSNNMTVLPTNLPFSGPAYTVDKTAPQVQSVTRNNPNPTSASSVNWTVTFTEPVNGGLTASNYGVVNTGLGGSTTIGTPTGTGATRTVTVSTGTGSGTLELDVVSATGITDAAGNLLTGLTFKGTVYTIDRAAPTVAITANNAVINDYKTGPAALTLSATFNEPMDTSVAPMFSFPVEDPGLNLGFVSAGWTDSTTFQAVYNVFDLNVGMPNIDVRVTGGKDAAGNSFTNSTAADLVSIDTQNPTVSTIVRNNPSPTNLATVGWTVTFSESITGISTSNFTLFNGDLGGPAFMGVTGGGTTWTVTASTGSGQGTLALYVDSTIGVTDAAGNPLAALPVIGPAYAVDHVAPAAAQLIPNTLLINDQNAVPNGFTLTVGFNEVMDQAVVPTVSFPIENPVATLALASAVWLDAKTFRASYNVTDAGVELADVDVSITGAKDAVGNVQTPLSIGDLFDIDTRNPTATVKVNDGSVQRSHVTSLTVTFSEPVQLPVNPADAFDLGAGVTIAADTVSLSTPTQTVAVLTFSGPNTQFGSLVDGKHTLKVLSAQVIDLSGNGFDGDGNSTAGDDYNFEFHRLYGDADGNGTVNQADYIAFRNAFNGGPSLAFDYEGDGQVSQADYIQFRNRFNLTV